jgi:UDP-N-acetylglucosamine 4,6-dehydratase/5-epimerase
MSDNIGIEYINNMTDRISNKKLLIIGGSGSLGNQLIKRYIEENEIYVYSRDECKHWQMQLTYNNHHNLKFIIGNIIDKNKLQQTLIRHNFNIIINAAAMKHIDKCEYESNECINTNLIGTQSLVDLIENYKKDLTRLEKVCFISTDKACSPVNIYGMSKAISESLFVEKARYIPEIKFVVVRYGNVLNSRGSIIPILHEIGKSKEINEFKLTDERMTRFVMTLNQSVDLIEHALLHAESGDIVIPKLISCKIKDMIEIFSEIYYKPIKKIDLRPGEKLLESLINETQSLRLMKFINHDYKYIKPPYKNIASNCNIQDYNSRINPLSKTQLKEYLSNEKLIDLPVKPEFNLLFKNEEIILREPYWVYVKENVLNDIFAIKLRDEILNIPDSDWDRYENPFEKKYTFRDKNNFPQLTSSLFKYLTSDEMLKKMSELGYGKVKNDPTRNWFGIHKYDDGDKLDIHVDAGLHPVTKDKKLFTLGIYLSKDWKEENGGHLEIWNGENASNDNAELKYKIGSVLPSFNKLIIFHNNDYSWHGNPDPISCKDGEKRIFLTLSYLCSNPIQNYENTRQKAFFISRPNDPDDEEKDKLRLLRADPKKYKDIYRITKNDC